MRSPCSAGSGLYTGFAFLSDRGLGSLRQYVLLAAAHCRRRWRWFEDPRRLSDVPKDPRVRVAVEAAERFADGHIPRAEFARAAAAAKAAADDAGLLMDRVPDDTKTLLNRADVFDIVADTVGLLARTDRPDPAFLCELADLADGLADFGRLLVQREGGSGVEQDAARWRELLAHAGLVRDVFGNPFRPVAFAPGWRTTTAVALADGMYRSRDFDRMPVLADALEEAGCDSADVLAHCRGDDPHARGCWVVDLVLGKS